ncbi:hypothetical protein N7492_009140 [Penicillium capsulatum]|uniref:Uncharacterized protein n=1 Tax=Penicillium capsulatum TaxID=69766 RepID=A0A9W9HTE2_9EURO|nr:hypothetical protein N7492_009140 [Penicillium capsulatum]KAJ6106539.1 hypothetical protein N7512_010056 [Penicillium capsulatum]
MRRIEMEEDRSFVMPVPDYEMVEESGIDACEMTCLHLDPDGLDGGGCDVCVGGGLCRSRSSIVPGGIDDGNHGLVALDHVPMDYAKTDAGSLLCESFEVHRLAVVSFGGRLLSTGIVDRGFDQRL